MRLSDKEQFVIISSINESFQEVDKIILFGSRMDDNAKGGDIDLLVVSEDKDGFQSKLDSVSKIQLKLGEQRVDLLVCNYDRLQSREPIILSAIKGIELWKKQ